MSEYGKELILDLHGCNPSKFTRKSIRRYFKELVDLIDMERGPLYFWDYKGMEEEYKKAPDHLKGTSAIQFISTSNITIHALDVLKNVYLNVFSCKDFNEGIVIVFSNRWFEGWTNKMKVIRRT